MNTRILKRGNDPMRYLLMLHRIRTSDDSSTISSPPAIVRNPGVWNGASLALDQSVLEQEVSNCVTNFPCQVPALNLTGM